SGITLSGTNIINGVTAPYIAQTNGTGSGNTLTSLKVATALMVGTSTADALLEIYGGNIDFERTDSAPLFNFYRNSAIPAAEDSLGVIYFYGNNGTPTTKEYAAINGVITDKTAGSEDGRIGFWTMVAGVAAERMRLEGSSLGIGTTTPQTKLSVAGDISIQSSGYVNFNPGAGTASSGYGIRDNSGTTQFKNSGGTWTDIPSGAIAGGFTDNGTTITETTVTDLVVFGSTTSSNRQLTCVGSSTFYGQVAIGSNTTVFGGLTNTLMELAIGDSDTGFKWIQDGDFALYGNSNLVLKIDGNANKVLIGTTTSGTKLNVGGTVTAEGFSGIGAGLTNVSAAFSDITGSATASQIPLISGLLGSATSAQLPTILELLATTTAITGTSANARWIHNTSTSTTALVLCFFNHPGTTTSIDSSAYARTITLAGGAIGTTSAKFGSGGLGLSTGDYAEIADAADLEIGSGDFTLEGWAYSTVIGDVTYSTTIFGKVTADASGYGPISIAHNNAGNINVVMSSNGSSWDIANFSFGAFTLNTAHHYAVSRQGSTIRGFLDGVQGGTATSSAVAIDISAPWRIGKSSYTGGDQSFFGWEDEVLITRTARYVSNFTPPTQAYNDIQNSLRCIVPNTTTPIMNITSNPDTSLLIHKFGTASAIVATGTTAYQGFGTTTPVAPAHVLGANNQVAQIIQINGAIDATSDVFVSFRDNTGAEQGSIACSGVANVVSYNASLDTHYTYIGNKTGLSSLDVLERDGGIVGAWDQLSKTVWTEQDEPELDVAGNPIYADIIKAGTETVKMQRFKKVNKLIKSNIKIEGQSPKNQIPLSKICSTAKSKSAWGVYTGTKSNGVDIVASNGTCLGKVINLGNDLMPGDLLCSSSYKGFLELQEGLITIGGITINDKNLVMNYTLASVSENVIWEAGETSRTIAVNLIK
ncbi:MAG: LamG domain-containing protein, partial [Patescibacteria group bacterium]